MKVIRTCDLLSTKYSLRNTYSFNTFSTNVALLYPPPPPENIRKPSVKYLGYYISPGSSRLDVIKSPENISCCIKLLL